MGKVIRDDETTVDLIFDSRTVEVKCISVSTESYGVMGQMSYEGVEPDE